MLITQVKIYPLTDSKTKALCSITINDEFVITGLKVLSGANGIWVAMPNRKDNKGEYHDIAFPITKEAREEIQNAVILKYDESQGSPAGQEIFESVSESFKKKESLELDIDADLLPF